LELGTCSSKRTNRRKRGGGKEVSVKLEYRVIKRGMDGGVQASRRREIRGVRRRTTYIMVVRKVRVPEKVQGREKG